MNPVLLVLVSGIGLNGLVILGFLFSGRGELILSVAAGASLPILLSAVLLYLGKRAIGQTPQYYQNLNIIGFGVKIILIGGWAALLISGGTLHNVTVIVTLLTNFLAWHMTEAYHWPLFVAQRQEKEGESA